jgi:hypothetical protein
MLRPVGGAGGASPEESDGRYVNVNGDTMTGALQLWGDPTDDLEAATKQYVDDAVGEISDTIANDVYTKIQSDGLFVDTAGDTMTGGLAITIDSGSSDFPLDITNTNRSGLVLRTPEFGNGTLVDGYYDGDHKWRLDLGSGETDNQEFQLSSWDNSATRREVMIISRATGEATFNYPLSVPMPTEDSHAATKEYVDDNAVDISGLVDIAGDTMTGALYLSGDPSSDLQAATKRYIDSRVASIVVQDPPAGLTEDDVRTMINNAVSILNGTPVGVVTTVDVSAGNVTISGASWDATDTFKIVGATVPNRTVTLPSGKTGTRGIVSDRTTTKTVTIAQGTASYKMPSGSFIIVYLDGTANFLRVLASGGSADFVARSGDTMTGALALSGAPTAPLHAATKAYVDALALKAGVVVEMAGGINNEKVRFRLPYAVTFTAGGVIYGTAGTAAAGSATYNVKRAPPTVVGGNVAGTFTTFATAAWSATGTEATASISSTVNALAGDWIQVEGPATADATLAAIGITLVGTKA